MKRLAAAFLAAVTLTGCGPEADNPLNYIVAPTESDSLTYYYGLLQGASYWQQSKSDTVMAEKDQRKRYLKGLRDGIDAVSEVNDPYHKGLEQGLALAMELYDLNRRSGVKINRDLLYNSVEYALQNDSVVNAGEAREEYQRLLRQVQRIWTDKEKARVRLSLSQEAARLKLKKISDDLYMTVRTPGKGVAVKNGDIVFVSADYRLPGGRNLSFPSSETLRVGSATMSGVITEALTHMNQGETAMFATTAMALFGDRAEVIRLSPDDVVLVTISIDNVENPDTIPNARDISI